MVYNETHSMKSVSQNERNFLSLFIFEFKIIENRGEKLAHSYSLSMMSHENTCKKLVVLHLSLNIRFFL